MSNTEAKKKYWKKVYDNAPIIECSCGCGEKIKSKDKYGRNKKFVNGHNNRKYEDPKQYQREYTYRNREKRYKYKVERAKKLKIELIEKSGSKCKMCGLEHTKNNSAVFDFHHTDSTLKKFGLNLASLQNKSLKLIYEEHSKCELLCANCHRLLHWSNN